MERRLKDCNVIESNNYTGCYVCIDVFGCICWLHSPCIRGHIHSTNILHQYTIMCALYEYAYVDRENGKSKDEERGWTNKKIIT